MNTPPLLLGATLLFWGWQTGLLWIGVAIGAVLEGARVIKARWEFSQTDLDRIWNLSVLLFLGAAVYAFALGEGASIFGDLIRADTPGKRLNTLNKSALLVLQLFQWMPLPLLPIALAQAFNTRSSMDWSTFSWWLRRKRTNLAKANSPPAEGLNVGYPYFAACLFAVSATNQRTLWFAGGLALLLSWGLWARRPRGYSPSVGLGALACAVVIGLPMQAGFYAMQRLLQRLDSAIISRLSSGRNFDPKESRTALGSIGRLKLSGRIVLRVEAGESAPPALLREASYNKFLAPIWKAAGPNFSIVTPESTQNTWLLIPDAQARRTVTIAGSLPGGKGLLALPQGTARLEQLPVFLLETNRLGVVRSREGPGFVRFSAVYGSDASIDCLPDTNDLDVLDVERPALGQVAGELGLPGVTDQETLSRVREFFAKRFVYSTWRGAEHLSSSNHTALAAFLLQHRSGHCEYFATATTLLLRQAGIPARYAVGYAVEEKKGRNYVVRERHAHAWCLAWINGAWREVDTTPGSWIAIESKRASIWEPIRDALSRASFEFAKWRWGTGEWKRYLVWLVWPLLLLAAARLLLSKQWNRARQRLAPKIIGPGWPGLDSEFYRIEQHFTAQGLGRQGSETVLIWLRRITSGEDGKLRQLEPILSWHYRLRFDPRGLEAEERGKLKEAVEHWLRQTNPER